MESGSTTRTAEQNQVDIDYCRVVSMVSGYVRLDLTKGTIM